MKRGLFAVLALAAATFAQPVSAAPPKGVVYEVVRHPSAPIKAEVTVHRQAGADERHALLVPQADGGYEQWSGGGSWSLGEGTTQITVELPRGHRFIAGGPRGRIKVTVGTKGWSVREIGSGFRKVTVSAESRLSVAGTAVARYARVTVPGGPYGSLADATVTCGPGYGEWSFGTEEERRSVGCGPFGVSFASADTFRGRTWTVDAEAYGIDSWDVTIVVMDLPKRY